MFSVHSANGASDFLGLRVSRQGEPEIVYDNGRSGRSVWRVVPGGCDESALRAAMVRAVSRPRVMAALFAELKSSAITLEAVGP